MMFEMYFIVVDAKGDRSTVTIPIPNTVALTDLSDAVTDMAELISAVVTGGIVGAGVRIEVDVSSVVTTVAGAISDVQEKARFVFRGENGFLKSLGLPTFSEDLFVAASTAVDLTDTNVAAFVTAMTDGYTVTSTNLISPGDVRGDDLESLESAQEAWGKARR